MFSLRLCVRVIHSDLSGLACLMSVHMLLKLKALVFRGFCARSLIVWVSLRIPNSERGVQSQAFGHRWFQRISILSHGDERAFVGYRHMKVDPFHHRVGTTARFNSYAFAVYDVIIFTAWISRIVRAAQCRSRFAFVFAFRSWMTETWLILPVVICLSQRLSHACLSISLNTAKLRMAH